MTTDQMHRYQTRVSLIPTAVPIPWRTISDQRHRTIGTYVFRLPSKDGTRSETKLSDPSQSDTLNNWYHPKDDDTRSESSISNPSQSDIFMLWYRRMYQIKNRNIGIRPESVWYLYFSDTTEGCHTPKQNWAAEYRGATLPATCTATIVHERLLSITL